MLSLNNHFQRPRRKSLFHTLTSQKSIGYHQHHLVNRQHHQQLCWHIRQHDSFLVVTFWCSDIVWSLSLVSDEWHWVKSKLLDQQNTPGQTGSTPPTPSRPCFWTMLHFFPEIHCFFSELCDQITVYISKNLQQNFWERKWPPPPIFLVVPNVRSWLRQRRKDGDLVTVSHLLPQSFHKSAPRASAAAHQIHIWGKSHKGQRLQRQQYQNWSFGRQLFFRKPNGLPPAPDAIHSDFKSLSIVRQKYPSSKKNPRKSAS